LVLRRAGPSASYCNVDDGKDINGVAVWQTGTDGTSKSAMQAYAASLNQDYRGSKPTKRGVSSNGKLYGLDIPGTNAAYQASFVDNYFGAQGSWISHGMSFYYSIDTNANYEDAPKQTGLIVMFDDELSKLFPGTK
jgi:hypothetical protein